MRLDVAWYRIEGQNGYECFAGGFRLTATPTHWGAWDHRFGTPAFPAEHGDARGVAEAQGLAEAWLVQNGRAEKLSGVAKTERKELFGELLPRAEMDAIYAHPAAVWLGLHHRGSSLHSFDDGTWEARDGSRMDVRVSSRESPLDAVKILARSLGWQDTSGEKTGAPIRQPIGRCMHDATKGALVHVELFATGHGSMSRSFDAGTAINANEQVELRPDGKVYPLAGQMASKRGVEYLPPGEDGLAYPTSVNDEGTGSQWPRTALGSALVEAYVKVCTCGTKSRVHADTCGALTQQWGNLQLTEDDLARIRNGGVLTTPWTPPDLKLGTIHADAMEEADRLIRKALLGTDPSMRPSLEWLARDLGIDPAAPDDVVKATVRKRLAGQFAEYDSLSARNVELRGRVEDAQRRLEDALQEIASEQQENDTLRGMVAEVQLENRKLRRGR